MTHILYWLGSVVRGESILCKENGDSIYYNLMAKCNDKYYLYNNNSNDK